MHPSYQHLLGNLLVISSTIISWLVPSVSSGCSLAENQKTDDVTAYTGDSVLLPCSCTDPHAKPKSFTWRKHNTNRNSWDVITSESEQYRNRVQMGTAHSPGNLSLLISHLTEEDKGYYRCYLNQYYKDISLTVKGCSLAENQKTDDITAYTGDSVLLPCSCTEPHAKPENFTWQKYNTRRQTWDVITSESEQYRNRVQMGTAHSPGNLSLLISHLTEEDKGDYRCYLTNQKYKDIRLTVKGCSLAENQKTDDVTAYTGDSVLLPCSCTDPHAKPESFTWRKHNTNRNSWDVITSESEQYRNRVQMGTAHSPGNLSLLISHLTEEDKGYYRCYLNQYYKDIRLTIKGCSLAENQKTDYITAYTGDSVLLPCSCTEPHAKPERFTWEKHNTNRNSWDMITSESEQYRNRDQLGTAHSPGNLSLLISHLTEEHKGDYRCYLTNQKYKDIRLTIKGCSLAENQKTDDITAYTGDSVLLPCFCTEPHAKPESFTWKKRNTSRDTWDVISIESEQYRNRVQLGTVHSPGNLSLLISHLTEEDEGDYSCYLTNQKYKDIRLTVKEAPYKPVNPPPVDTDTTSPTASTKPTTTMTSPNGAHTSPLYTRHVILAGVGVLLLLMGLGGVICWRYRVQRREQTVSREGQTGQRRDQQTQDDVMYSTVAQINTTRPAPRAMDNGDNTEYARIKLN
ncbi:polymeric immunoglobulin receptor-like [Electrophorus electricus]|uniref:polymeric immunoglobulin receptor-like n=1 Tax=Electrophorus electricus TaxID=8005 RepID=UPI0015CFFED0|nr:polymeric immunoglobulin receptor-like [Electrophorus electricus]